MSFPTKRGKGTVERKVEKREKRGGECEGGALFGVLEKGEGQKPRDARPGPGFPYGEEPRGVARSKKGKESVGSPEVIRKGKRGKSTGGSGQKQREKGRGIARIKF